MHLIEAANWIRSARVTVQRSRESADSRNYRDALRTKAPKRSSRRLWRRSSTGKANSPRASRSCELSSYTLGVSPSFATIRHSRPSLMSLTLVDQRERLLLDKEPSNIASVLGEADNERPEVFVLSQLEDGIVFRGIGHLLATQDVRSTVECLL